MQFDITKVKKIHFIGIKGVALSGLAVICQQQGKQVAGSDTAEKFITDPVLKENGITVYEGFAVNNLDWNPECVVVGASWPDTHVEVQAAKEKGVLVITDSLLRGALSRLKRTIAITGTHGKTTTTALLAYIHNYLQLQPSYLVGTGMVKQLPAHAQWAEGQNFIIESDEYIKSQADHEPKFLDLSPAVTVVTSLEYEHVDVYDNIEQLEGFFSQLLKNTAEKAVVCGDWASCQNIVRANPENVITYGKAAHNTYYIDQILAHNGITTFTVIHNKQLFGEYTLQLWGDHNVLNALACIVVAEILGLNRLNVKQAIAKFSGLQRRTEITKHKGITFIDDYGHHPTEVRVTLDAIKQHYPDKKLCCIFQSHTFTRTQKLLKDFVQSFASADILVVVNIFSSAREKITEFTTEDFIHALQQHHSNVVLGGTISETVEYLQSRISSDTIYVTMGAGDVYKVRDALCI